MHCVSAYPTEDRDLEIHQIRYLIDRYDGVPIGFSTHETPDNYKSIFMAVAAGAAIFEKHVGIQTEAYKLNNYSCTPEQFTRWLNAAKEAFLMNGAQTGRMTFKESAVKGISAFTRGAFAKKDLRKGDEFGPNDIFLAIPNINNQLLSFNLSKYASFTAQKDIQKNTPVLQADITVKNAREIAGTITKKISAMLKTANIVLPNGLNCSISAHYGLNRFDEYGAVIIDVLNREYCKKIIILTPGQKHPPHLHQKKEETFQVLYGSLKVNLDGAIHHLSAGDLLTIGRGQRHEFETIDGVIFEEISTTHYKNDSFYDDKAIMEFGGRKIEYRLFL